MATTLADAAPPDRGRPTGRDILDVLWSALRCRLRLPRGIGYRLVAFFLGLLAALIGSLLTIQLMDTVNRPTEDEAVALARLATGVTPVNIPGPVIHCPVWCPDPPGTGDKDQVIVYDDDLDRNGGVDHALVVYTFPPALLTQEAISQVLARLESAGWVIDSGSDIAHRGDLNINPVGGVAPDTLDLLIDRRPSTVVATAWVLGGSALAVLAIWLPMCWAMQRYRRHGLPVRLATLLLTVPMTVLVIATEAQIGIGLSNLTRFGDLGAWPLVERPAIAVYFEFLFQAFFYGQFAVEVPHLGLVLAAGASAALALTALPIRPRAPRREPTPAT